MAMPHLASLFAERLVLIKLVHAEGRDFGKCRLVAGTAAAEDDNVVAEGDRAAMMADHDRRAATGS